MSSPTATETAQAKAPKPERRFRRPRSGDRILRRARVWVSLTTLTGSVIGALIVVIYGFFLIPTPDLPNESHIRFVNALAAAGYLAFALPVGTLWGLRRTRGMVGFVREGRPPTDKELRYVLRTPVRIARVVGALWFVAVVVFWVLNSTYDARLGVAVAVTVALGGVGSASISYLLAERFTRNLSSLALAQHTPDRPQMPGVLARNLLSWMLGTAMPLLALLGVAIYALSGQDVPATKLQITTISIAGAVMGLSLVVAYLNAKAVSDPVRSVQRALRDVEQGDFDTEVTVWDGSEVGMLQSGFNAMVDGLRERERIRETFGAYVDPKVAEHVLEEGGGRGEEVEVTVMFCDVRDFTGFASDNDPAEVLSTLNRLFDLAVPIVTEHGGHIDKFIGDGLMAVFGAPGHDPEHAKHALDAALKIDKAVAKELGDELKIGIGLNSGSVIAGNVGGSGRLEFSVIGDAVNVAARVESATRETGDRVLVSSETVALLGESAPVKLVERPGIELKGKRDRVTLHAPAS